MESFIFWAEPESVLTICSVYHRRFSAYIKAYPDPLRQSGELLLKTGVSKSLFSFDAVLVQAVPVRQLYWMYLLSHLFACFLFPHKAMVVLHVSYRYHRPHAFPDSCGLSLAQQVSHFSCTTGFSARGTVNCIFPSVSQHKGIAFISLITAHDRLFWTSFIPVSWSNKISSKVDVAQHFLLWFLGCCGGFQILLVRV